VPERPRRAPGRFRDRDEGKRGDERDEEEAVPAPDPPPCCRRIGRPSQHQRHDHERSGRIAQPPRAPELRDLRRSDYATREHRHGPDRCADCRRDPDCDEHSSDLLGPVERRTPTDQPAKKPGADDDFGEIPSLLADETSDRQRVEKLTVDGQLGDEDPRP
jgi:hypothetical protein